MRKLTMDLDALSVESFDLSPEGARPFGTVLAHRFEGVDRAFAKPTLDDSQCPIYSCGCSNGVPFTECECDPAVPEPGVIGVGG